MRSVIISTREAVTRGDRMHVLDIRNLRVRFPQPGGTVNAVNGISFSLNENEILGIIGESGSGKSVTVKSIMRLLAVPPAEVSADCMEFNGTDLLSLSEAEMRAVRGNGISMIFQNPMSSFNPIMRLGKQVEESLLAHSPGMAEAERRKAVINAFHAIGISNPELRAKQYPYEFSGGMLQRAMIASALISNPKVLLADEPTTGLDVTIQEQILNLIRKLRESRSMSIIFITHDLSLLAGFADRIIIMYAGSIAEEGTVDDIFYRPAHPYTRGLLKSIPSVKTERGKDLFQIKGTPPDPAKLGAGCPFAARCPEKSSICTSSKPCFTQLSAMHSVACHARSRQMRREGNV